jgi:hypothetical protein
VRLDVSEGLLERGFGGVGREGFEDGIGVRGPDGRDGGCDRVGAAGKEGDGEVAVVGGGENACDTCALDCVLVYSAVRGLNEEVLAYCVGSRADENCET